MFGFKGWRVQNKLVALQAVFLGGFLLFVWTAFDTLEAVKINGKTYQQIVQAKDIIADVLPPPEYIIESYLTVLRIQDETNPARLEAMKEKLRELRADYEKRHVKWEDELASSALKTALVSASYRPAVEFYQVAESQFIPAIDRGDRIASQRVLRGALAQKYEAHRVAIDETVKLAEQQGATQVQQADALIAGRTSALKWIGGVLVFVVLGISVWLAHSISQPLKRVSSVISTFLAEFAATISEQERSAAQQAVAVNETTTTMEELGASSRLSAEQAEAASNGTRQALSLADEGNRTVNQTLDGMSGLKERSTDIAEQILRLSDQTSQIGNITNLVSDLANQTNLLALNAAVEAARAGEHGKGFAVVASEIRKLADQSKRSAERISALVSEIQQATNATVMVTEEGTKTAQEGTRLAQRTGDAFHGLSAAIDSTYESVQQIALNARQQSAAVSQVVEAMTSLNAGARETAEAISQTKSGILRLNDAAKELTALV